jgi:hypothetical protein
MPVEFLNVLFGAVLDHDAAEERVGTVEDGGEAEESGEGEPFRGQRRLELRGGDAGFGEL